DMSVLANEQVINGYCERHPDTRVEQRFLEQWFFAITRYAERLLKNLDWLDWSASTRTLQRNWIGRSEGAELVFETPDGHKIPVWIADYVLMEYGTGAIMAVPAHDRRDFEFATAFKLPIRPVVRAEGPLPTVSEDGVLMNSGEFDGLPCRDAGRRIVAWLLSKGLATPQVQYRLHDWCISRQRYWGPPIPIIYCDRCGPVGVPERDLPVLLPFIEDFRPDASGVSPLARHKEWYYAKCPQRGAQGRRET